MNQRVTIQQIAESCGVSKMAVSFALRGSNQVSPSLREIILQKARELGYVPSRAARNLNGITTPRIGIVLPLPGSPVHARNLQAFDQACRERGIETDVHFHYWHAESEQKILQSLFDDGVTGLILHPSGSQTHETLLKLQNAGLSAPLVTFGSLRAKQDTTLENYLGNYAPETESASRICLEHLVGIGHKHIAFLFQGPLLAHGSMPRQAQSFLAAARQFPDVRLELFYLDDSSSPIRQKILRGIPCELEDLIETDDQLARHFLDHPFEATVAITSDDLSALSLLNECQRRRIRVPQDLSIVSLGGSSICRMATLSLAHAAVNIKEVANHVLDRLLHPPSQQQEEYTYALSMVHADTLSTPNIKKKHRQTQTSNTHRKNNLQTEQTL